MYTTYGGGGEPILPDPVPIDPIGPIRPMPILLDAQAVEEPVAPARKKRSIWWPGGGGGARSKFNVRCLALFLRFLRLITFTECWPVSTHKL